MRYKKERGINRKKEKREGQTVTNTEGEMEKGTRLIDVNRKCRK